MASTEQFASDLIVQAANDARGARATVPEDVVQTELVRALRKQGVAFSLWESGGRLRLHVNSGPAAEQRMGELRGDREARTVNKRW